MATDIHKIQREICSFYDFGGKSVIHVGAGGGQFIDYADQAAHVTAVDCDPAAIEALIAAAAKKGLAGKFEVIEGDFAAVSTRADLVFFEFCLHEIHDSDHALERALRLAPEVLVVDHHPESAWAWHTCETEKAQRSWAAVQAQSPRRKSDFQAIQYFADYAELYAKLEPLGLAATARLIGLPRTQEIRIGMGYSMALLVR